jgi:hypothetical protein
MKLEVFVYGRDYKPYFNPRFYRKFKTIGTMETNYGLTKIYELNNVYLAILFKDGVVYDGLTVIKQRDRDGFYPVGYVDEVGNLELVETSKEKLLRKLAYLKRYENKIIKEIHYPPIKNDNTDPLEPDDYWSIKELFYSKLGTEPKKILTIALQNGWWENCVIDVFMLQREGRDNKDFIVVYDAEHPKETDRVFEIYGKLGETYILKPYAIKHLCDEKEAIRLVKVIKENYQKVEDLEALDKAGYELLDKIEILCYNT